MFSHRALSRPVLVFSVLATVIAPPAAADRAEVCDGVTVAVDTTGAGGPGLVTRCASGDPGDARTALERAGFAVHAGAGGGPYGDRDYVCRVDGLPAVDGCDGHRDGQAYWKVWRVGIDPVSWRGSGTDGGPSALRVCRSGLVGFSFGVGSPAMTVTPEQVIARPGWLPPHCRA